MSSQASLASAYHFDRDGAAVNSALILKRQWDILAQSADCGSPCLSSDMTCANHRNQLCEAAVNDAYTTRQIGALYRSALLFRQGANWTRMLCAVEVIVERELEFHPYTSDVAAPAEHEYNIELEDYLRSNHVFARQRPHWDERDDDDECLTLAGADKEWNTSLDNFVSSVTNHYCNSRLGHACRSKACCNKNRLAACKKVTNAIRSFLMRLLCAMIWICRLRLFVQCVAQACGLLKCDSA